MPFLLYLLINYFNDLLPTKKKKSNVVDIIMYLNCFIIIKI